MGDGEKGPPLSAQADAAEGRGPRRGKLFLFPPSSPPNPLPLPPSLQSLWPVSSPLPPAPHPFFPPPQGVIADAGNLCAIDPTVDFPVAEGDGPPPAPTSFFLQQASTVAVQQLLKKLISLPASEHDGTPPPLVPKHPIPDAESASVQPRASVLSSSPPASR